MSEQYQTAENLVASVKTLLTLPEVYLRVKAVVDDADSCLADLVDAVSIDPGITARLLRIANSAYFNTGVAVDNVRQAVNLLGTKAVHNLVLATSLSSSLSQSSSNTLDMKKFWENSVRCAVFARSIAFECDEPEHERLFVNGLLSNIGHQVMYMQMPELTSIALDKSISSGVVPAEAESELLGFNYAEVGGELLRAWGMPDSISEVVRHHVAPEGTDEFYQEASIIQIANVLAQFYDTQLDAEMLLTAIKPAAWQSTGMVPEILLGIHQEASVELEETIDLLLGFDKAA